jgi:hypothetical protein
MKVYSRHERFVVGSPFLPNNTRRVGDKRMAHTSNRLDVLMRVLAPPDTLAAGDLKIAFYRKTKVAMLLGGPAAL